MKTIREWLETLPDGYRERALANMDEISADQTVSRVNVALGMAFDWEEAREGFDFWLEVSRALRASCDFPPLPKQSENDHLKQRIAKLEAALKAIVRNDEGSKYGEGICCYGCDSPNIAREALAGN